MDHMDHKTEQDAGLLEQAATMLEEHAEEQRTRGNDSAAEGAACSAHAIRRLAPALLRAGAAPAAVAGPADDLAELAMLNKLIELGAKASYAHAKSNSDDGPAGTDAYVQWQELRAEMGELIRTHVAPALEAPAAPAVEVLRALMSLVRREAPHLSGKVMGDAEAILASAALAAAPQAQEAPVAVEGVAQFRKRPVTISAIQWKGKNLREVITFTDGPPETRGTHAGMAWEAYTDLVERDGLMIYTLEGKMHASVGDWIIRGVKGEHYACKPDIFAETYEPAMAAPAAPAVDASAQVARDAGFNHGVCLALQIMASAGNAGDAEWTELLNCAGREEIMHYARHVETESWLLCGFAAIAAQAKEGGAQ